MGFCVFGFNLCNEDDNFAGTLVQKNSLVMQQKKFLGKKGLRCLWTPINMS